MSGQLTRPEILSDVHDLVGFHCGEASLDEWLIRRAIRNNETGASRTYVVCDGRRVAGFYCLSTGAVAQAVATSRVRRNMPEPIPVIILGRLAVDAAYKGRGIGEGLLRDAIQRTVQAAEVVGIRAILVHAISESAKRFYMKFDFEPSATEPMTLMITLADARLALA